MQHRMRCVPAPFFAPLPVQHLPGGEVQPSLGQHLPCPGGALPRGQEPVRPGHVGDPGPAAGEQMPDGQRAALLVIGDQGQLSRVLRLGHHVDHRDRQASRDRWPRVGAPSGDDDAVHLAGQQRAHVVLLPDRVAPAVAEQGGHLALAQCVLRAEHDRDGEPAEAVRGDQPDRVAAAGQQSLGQQVRPETEPLGRGLYPLPGLGPQLAAPVERLGHRADRYPGQGGDVSDGHRTGLPHQKALS